MPENTSQQPIQPSNPSQGGEIFPETPPAILCSWNECLVGHRWATTFQAVKCPGCQGMTLAIKKENCPYCNEPCVKASIRTDHIPRGGGLTPRCQGQTSPHSETMDILLERSHWREAEEGAKLFTAEG